MYVYDKKDKSIDIYSMEAKKEELKKYRERILKRHKNDQLFYYLKTNSDSTLQNILSCRETDMSNLIYDNSTPLDVGTFSDLFEIQERGEQQMQILQRYIEGQYDSECLTRVFKYRPEVDKEEDIYKFLKPEGASLVTQTSHGNIWVIDNLLDLPQNLYLLHLLNQGRFNELTDKNITKQLQLFEFEYKKNVPFSDIQEMIETGLVNGTLYDAVQKAEVGTKILQKAKKSIDK